MIAERARLLAAWRAVGGVVGGGGLHPLRGLAPPLAD